MTRNLTTQRNVHRAEVRPYVKEHVVNQLIYLVGLVVIIVAVLSFLGFN